MPWPFGPDEEVTEEVKPKRKTKKDKLAEQEELVALLKFTPRTYRVMLSGYGGEIVLGSVPREQYEYFRDNNIDIEEFASDWNNESEVPEEMEIVKQLCQHAGIEMPNVVTDIYKNRRGKFAGVKLFRYFDYATCRTRDLFMTGLSHNIIKNYDKIEYEIREMDLLDIMTAERGEDDGEID